VHGLSICVLTVLTCNAIENAICGEALTGYICGPSCAGWYEIELRTGTGFACWQPSVLPKTLAAQVDGPSAAETVASGRRSRPSASPAVRSTFDIHATEPANVALTTIALGKLNVIASRHSPTKAISSSIALGVCLVALTMWLNVILIIFHWRHLFPLVLIASFCRLLIAVWYAPHLIITFLVARSAAMNSKIFLNAVTHELKLLSLHPLYLETGEP